MDPARIRTPPISQIRERRGAASRRISAGRGGSTGPRGAGPDYRPGASEASRSLDEENVREQEEPRLQVDHPWRARRVGFRRHVSARRARNQAFDLAEALPLTRPTAARPRRADPKSQRAGGTGTIEMDAPNTDRPSRAPSSPAIAPNVT